MSCPKWVLASLRIVAASAVAVLCRLGFDSFVGEAPAFLIPFLFPVVVAGLYGGMRWGLVATAFNAGIVAYFFTPPVYSFTIRDFDDRVRVGTFVVLGGVFSGLAGRLRHHRQRAEEHARTLEREVAVRQDAERLLEQRVAERTAEIESQKRLLDAVLDALPVAIIIADAAGRFVRVNRASYDVCGAVPSAKGVEDYPAWIGYWPGTGRRVEPMEWPLSRAVFGGESCTDQIVIERFGDHARRTLQISATTVRGPDGAIIAGVLTGVDLTDREAAERALRESERRFQAFMTHAPIAAWIVDAESRGVYTSPGFDPHLGLAPGSYIGRRPADLWPTEIAQAYVENDRRVMAGGVAVATEEPFVRPDGSQGVAHVVKFPMSGPQGEPLIGGVAIDITNGKRSEEALRASEERFRSAFDHAPIGVSLTATDGRWLRVNRSLCELTGYTEGELLASNFQAITHPDDLGNDLAQLEDFLDGKVHSYQTEKRYFHKLGHVVPVHVSVSMIRDDSGNPGHFVCHVMDITQRKEHERTVAANDAILRQFITHSPAAIAMFDREMRYVRASDRWLNDYGLRSRDIVGLSHYDVFPDIPDRWKSVHQRVLAGAVEGCDEDPLHQADGSTEWHRWECRPWLQADGEVGGLVMFTQIITERKRAEAALRLSEERFKTLAGDAPVGIFETNARGLCSFVNARWCKLAGLTRDEAMGQGWIAALHPDDRDRVFREWSAATEASREFFSEYRFRTPAGQTSWLSGNAVTLRDEAGGIVGFIGTVTDITERKRAEAALRSSEEQFRRLVDGVADHAIFMLDMEGHVLSWNPAAATIKGYATEEIVGRHFSVFYLPEAVAAGHPQRELAAAIAEGRHHGESERVRKDGSRFWAAVTISTLYDDTGRHVGFVKFTHDISPRRRAEALVLASLEEKEVLLKEIHHRVKNNLQIVSALLHLQSANVPDRAVREMFEETRGRVKSMALIHERLYRAGDLAGVDLSEYVRQLAADVYRAYRVSEESVRLELAVNVPPLPLDVAIPCGLILNELISNCLKHAFAGRAAGQINVTFRPTPDGNMVLSVSDDGVGFPPGLDLRTTTSFGFQLIHTLAEQLHGHANLTTGDGATVAVTFPAPKETAR